jgi:hypothetical protein
MWIATPSLQWTFTIYSLPVFTGAPCSDPNKAKGMTLNRKPES